MSVVTQFLHPWIKSRAKVYGYVPETPLMSPSLATLTVRVLLRTKLLRLTS